MTSPKEILKLRDYSNYRNIRAVSVLFVLVGIVAIIGSIALAFDKNRVEIDNIHYAFCIGLTLVGLAGAVGGFAALNGNRKFAWLAYVMAACYSFMFPVGTFLGVVMMLGLSRYLKSVDQIKASRRKLMLGRADDDESE